MFLGHPTHRKAKAKGGNSMSGKRLRSESVVGPVPRDPRDMVKAGLTELQSRDGAMATSAGRTLVTRRHPLRWPVVATNATPMGGSRPVRDEAGFHDGFEAGP